MANPQPTDAHLRVAHSINEAIMTRDFTKRQRKILDLILRLSWGCGKKDAYIPHQRDFNVVGVHEVDVKSELNWLEISKVITRDGSFYSFNKDFDTWEVSRVKPFEPEKLSKLLSLNLSKGRPELLTPNSGSFAWAGYIYIMEGQGIYKIGTSKEPESRLEAFLGLPFEVHLIFNEYVQDPSKLEAQIKKAYKHKHIRGEWYKFSQEDIDQIKELSKTLRLENKNLVKHEARLSETLSATKQNTKSATPELASPKERLKKVLNKDIYIELFNLWNELKVITHKKLTTDMKRAIDSAHQDYSQEEIEQAMKNYAVIVKGAEYYFSHKWTMAEFLSRHNSNNIERFLDLEIAKSNFNKGGRDGTHQGNSRRIVQRATYHEPDTLRQ